MLQLLIEMSDNRDLEPDSDVGTQDIDVEDTDEGSESDEDLAAAIDRGLEELEEEDEDEDEDSDEDDDDDDDDEDDEDDEKGKHSEIGMYSVDLEVMLVTLKLIMGKLCSTKTTRNIGN
jgi:hypothetical protein